VCEVCGKRFVSSEKLERHKRIHVGGKLNPRKGRKKCTKSNIQNMFFAQVCDKPYVCTACNKRFTTASNLNHHSHIHLQEKPDEFSQQLNALVDAEKTSGIYVGRGSCVSKSAIFYAGT
jgi:transcriptional regulator NrdR family protein